MVAVLASEIRGRPADEAKEPKPASSSLVESSFILEKARETEVVGSGR